MPRRARNGNARGSRYEAAPAGASSDGVIDAEFIEDDAGGAYVQPVAGATGVGAAVASAGRSLLEDLGLADTRVTWHGVGANAVVPTSSVTMSFGAAAGMAAGLAIVGGVAGWWLRGRASRRR